MSEDQQVVELDVVLSNRIVTRDPESTDPFEKQWKELKSYRGLSKNAVRRANRRLEKQFTGEDGAASKKVEIDYVYGYTYLECVSPPYNIEYLSKLYEISPAHHSAVNAKVDNIVGLGHDFVETPAVKARKAKLTSERSLKSLENQLNEAKDALDDWLSDVNAEDEFDEWIRKVWKDYETTGNGYIEVGRTASGQIGYLGHVPAETIRVRTKRDGFVQVLGRQVVYFRNFGDKTTANPLTDDSKPNEIIHFKKYSPTNSFYGVPDIIPAKSALAGNEFAARYNLDFFENKAVPRYIIVAKGGSLSAASQKRLVEFFETGLRGQHHRSIYVPLPPGDNVDLKFEAIESKAQDSSFGEYRVANNEEILMAHRVPYGRTGIQPKGASLASARDADKVFKESVCRPEQRIVEKKLNRIVKEKTDMYLIKLNELSLTDEDAQAGIDEKYLRNGVIVPDEIRARKAMPPRPDGRGSDPMVLSEKESAENAAKMQEASLESQAKARADQAKVNAQQAKERDSNRATTATDSKGEGRNAKGDGRARES